MPALYGDMMAAYGYNDGRKFAIDFLGIDSDVNVNWYDKIISKNAPMYQIDLAVSGGSKKTSYYFSGNYSDQGGYPSRIEAEPLYVPFEHRYEGYRLAEGGYEPRTGLSGFVDGFVGRHGGLALHVEPDVRFVHDPFVAALQECRRQDARVPRPLRRCQPPRYAALHAAYGQSSADQRFDLRRDHSRAGSDRAFGTLGQCVRLSWPYALQPPVADFERRLGQRFGFRVVPAQLQLDVDQHGRVPLYGSRQAQYQRAARSGRPSTAAASSSAWR